jgi:hypothetical protein
MHVIEQGIPILFRTMWLNSSCGSERVSAQCLLVTRNKAASDKMADRER